MVDTKILAINGISPNEHQSINDVLLSLCGMPLHQLIDIIVDTYFEEYFNFSPCDTVIRLPKQFIYQFKSHQDFWYYIANLYKSSIN